MNLLLTAFGMVLAGGLLVGAVYALGAVPYHVLKWMTGR